MGIFVSSVVKNGKGEKIKGFHFSKVSEVRINLQFFCE